jgi:threonine dehydrogenase-like Zn-dependent dehydrogenase
LKPATDVWVPLRKDMIESKIVFARLAQISAVALHRVRTKPDKILVLGAGMIGNFCAQWFGLATDALVAIQDVNASRLALAARCGIPNEISGEGAHISLFGSGGPDCVVEATGVPALVPDALRWVRRGGDVILLGSPRGKQELDIYKHIHAKSVALIGAHEGGVPLRAEAGGLSRQRLAEEAVEAIVGCRIKIDGLLSAEIEPDQIGSMYENMLTNRDKYIGAVVHWQGDPRKPPLSHDPA